MDAQDGRVVTSQARKDVEEAYDEEQLGGSKGVFLVIQMEGWFFFWPLDPRKEKHGIPTWRLGRWFSVSNLLIYFAGRFVGQIWSWFSLLALGVGSLESELDLFWGSRKSFKKKHWGTKGPWNFKPINWPIRSTQPSDLTIRRCFWIDMFWKGKVSGCCSCFFWFERSQGYLGLPLGVVCVGLEGQFCKNVSDTCTGFSTFWFSSLTDELGKPGQLFVWSQCWLDCKWEFVITGRICPAFKARVWLPPPGAMQSYSTRPFWPRYPHLTHTRSF